MTESSTPEPASSKSDPNPTVTSTVGATPAAGSKKLDLLSLIYLVGLALAIFCALFIDVVSFKLTMDGEPLEGELMGGIMDSFGSYPAIKSVSGKFAILAALAGIVIWIWNHRTIKTLAWAPKALAGCAALSAALYLVLMYNSRPSSSLEMVEVNVDMTPLGFWLPFAGAVIATLASLGRLNKRS
jgi:hypothetical protein